MSQPCVKEKEIGVLEDFMKETRGMKATLFTIAVAIILQVGTFLYLWGGLTFTVNNNTKYLWGDIAPKTFENTRNIDKILTRFEMIVKDKT